MFSLYSLYNLLFVTLTLLLSFISNNLLNFWLLLEISSFFLVYSFLNNVDNTNNNVSSFLFYLFSGISSILLISGGYFGDLFLILLSLNIKFFLFPFSIILYYIFNNCSWYLIFVVGTLFKGFIICLSYLFIDLNSSFNSLIILSIIFTWFFCIYMYLFNNLNLKGLWLLMSLNSSITMYIICLNSLNNIFFYFFILYLIISLFNIYSLFSLSYSYNYNIQNLSNDFLINYNIYFVSFPFSFNFIYKIISLIIILSLCNTLICLLWCFYTIIETFFLFFYFSTLLENNSIYY
uniref:NADH dehydrogenase subunit 2 n=1 Tax=Cichlidarus nyanzae TaxID=608002 RepID=A0A2Z4GPH1_9PLAT|nr:NADH dehydrogenase subunit 2 [Gyrodactylus nyanzae]AWW03128.1 NADH dehydrogenase subunit 2 [Gyrodactylus nyanzae]